MKHVKCPKCGNTNKYKLCVTRSGQWAECLECGYRWDTELES